MAIAALVLEYLKVVMSWPVAVTALGLIFLIRFHEPIAALINRVASIRIPGGAEVLTPQAAMNVLHSAVAAESIAESTSPDRPETEAPLQGSAQTADNTEQLVRSERERARLWEYRFLNYFIVPGTQRLLDWLANRAPTSYSAYDAWTLTEVPDPLERQARINALRNHHLIDVNRDLMISVTPKGHEYLEWRGPLPQFLDAMSRMPGVVRAPAAMSAPVTPASLRSLAELGNTGRTSEVRAADTSHIEGRD